MKRRATVLAGVTAVATAASIVSVQPRKLVWNATASVPTGLYRMGGKGDLHVGERLIIDPPPLLRAYLARRGYLPLGVPLLKELAAVPGDTVCRTRLLVTINGAPAGRARAADSRGRALPRWQGCRTIAPGDVFVMNRRAPDSFDGRYFGPIARSRIVGRAIPLWTDEAGNGAHVWFAREHTIATTEVDKETRR